MGLLPRRRGVPLMAGRLPARATRGHAAHGGGGAAQEGAPAIRRPGTSEREYDVDSVHCPCVNEAPANVNQRQHFDVERKRHRIPILKCNVALLGVREDGEQ